MSILIAKSLRRSGWAVDRRDMAVLRREVARYQQLDSIRVVEFGAGVSTFLFLSLAPWFKKFSLVSFEADAAWHRTVSAEVDRIARRWPGLDSVRVVHAPYVSVGSYSGFDRAQIHRYCSERSADIVFVDAPPDVLGEGVRLQLSRLALPMVDRLGSLIVHDTERIEERFLVESLRPSFLSVGDFHTARGISVFRFPRALAESASGR